MAAVEIRPPPVEGSLLQFQHRWAMRTSKTFDFQVIQCAQEYIRELISTVDGDENLDEWVETQRSEAPWEKLEKNANNFLA